MQLTDWLVVIFVIAIVAVLLDGVRRKLGERRSRVVLKLDKNLPAGDFNEDTLSASELPNGGARTIPREGQPVPTLRNLKSTRKPLVQRHAQARPAPEPASQEEGEALGTVPVLMDTVEVEEEHIEHANVFADTGAGSAFAVDEFADAEDPAPAQPMLNPATAALAETEEFTEGLDEENEEDLPMLREEVTARKRTGYPGHMENGMLAGRDDDDDYDDDEDEDEDYDDEEDEDDEDDDFDDLNEPGDFEDDEEDYDDEDDDYEDDEDDDYDDEEDEDDDYGDEEDEDDDDLDELEGIPEDDWGAEEEQDMLSDDYENEPVLLQDAYSNVANHFGRGATGQPRIEPGFGEAQEFSEEELNEDFSVAQLDADEAQELAAAESMKPIPLTRRPQPVAPAARAAPDKPLTPEQQGELFRDEPPKPKSEGFKVPSFKMSVPKVSVPKIGMPRALAPEPDPVAEEPVDQGPQEVVIINVMARPGQVFYGDELLPVLQQQGMRLGDMSIFHRHAELNGREYVAYSMANMVKPGTFDLATMNEFTTPGVSFFLQLPNKLGNMQCFEKMLSAATAVRNALDGELKDENRSTFTRQTVEHCRQRVRDFELSLLARKQ